MEIIQSNNERLLQLKNSINDIRDLSKIESGFVEREIQFFNLSKVCCELFSMIQAKISNPNVEIRLHDSAQDSWGELDRNRLKQVWMNFLTNAI